jgi:hypothetical protein
MQKAQTPSVTKAQLAFVSDSARSTAARIKYLAGEGFSRADIARIMTAHSGKAVSYQWVKNVMDKVA